nr:MAG TPA: hydrolase [Caudoviricetes sp.]
MNWRCGYPCCVRTVTPHEAYATSIPVFVLVWEAR